MNVSYNWLQDLIEIDASPDQIAAELTRVGLAVEGIHPSGDDFILDVDLTSNRSDCLSHLGIAREVSALTGKPLKNERNSVAEGAESDSSTLVTIDPSAPCARFTARVIRDVKVGASPGWLVKRLESIGERSINNVADITNYVMHELGQPMHAFDYDRLEGNRIVVRPANEGETITTLDESVRELDSSMLAICDAEKPVAVAGIMGGLHSAISTDTVNVLLEVAYFDRSSIRSTSRKLNLRTEASHRFERGVDVEYVIAASERAADLIVELAGGRKDDFADIYPSHIPRTIVPCDDIARAVHRLSGLTVERSDAVILLDRLGITTDDGSKFVVPSWRHDITLEEDLVEEVVRLKGYENIATELPPSFAAGEYLPHEHRERTLRSYLASVGFDETMSYSFIDSENRERFDAVPALKKTAADDPFVRIKDAVIDGATLMRPTLLPGLVDAAKTNFNQQRRDLRLFEIGTIFGADVEAGTTPREIKALAVLMAGAENFEGRGLPGRPVDFYDLAGVVESVVGLTSDTVVRFEADSVQHLQPGQSAAIYVADEKIGYLGRLSIEIANTHKIKSPVYCAELDLAGLFALTKRIIRYTPLAKFPSISRDVSIIVDRRITFQEVNAAIFEDRPQDLQDVTFVDVFEGGSVEKGKKSLTVRLTYRSVERTMQDEEVDALHQQILSRLAKFH